MAATVGGSTWGVAKKVSLVAVKVLGDDGSGSYADVIAGVDYVAQQKRDNPSRPMVGNMSLGGIWWSWLNDAVNIAVELGVVFAVAAGE